MAHQNLLFANGQLFARKGEAVPAAVVPGFGRESMHRNPDGGGAVSANHGRTNPPASLLSSLIERRTGPVAGESATVREHEMPRPAAERPPKDGSGRSSEITPVSRALIKRTKSGNSRRPRRKLTLRLSQDDFVRIRSLTEFLDTTYQSILEKGVVNYVESLSTGVCRPQDVDQAVPISTGRSRR